MISEAWGLMKSAGERMKTGWSVILREWVEEDKPAYRRQRRSGQTSKKTTTTTKKNRRV